MQTKPQPTQAQFEAMANDPSAKRLLLKLIKAKAEAHAAKNPSKRAIFLLG